MNNKTEIFKALADETRLRILNLFIKFGESLCVCELTDALKLPQYHISNHLNVIRNSGILKPEREGTWVYYKLDNSNSDIKDLVKFLKNFLTEQQLEADYNSLKQRLLLREEGKCVIGFVSEVDLIKKIKIKTKE
ncbi:MAG: metalloregulator ArsR/SmtB family transcription factor [Ignavibacteriaceae bacterium]|nr:metalloregulator ArsR/SmtB family transcription factor [Ignavibacteriaceae bacterium]